MCRLVAELPATGGVVPSWSLSTVKLLRYVTPGDYFVLACEIIFMLFIVYYMIEEAIEVRTLSEIRVEVYSLCLTQSINLSTLW